MSSAKMAAICPGGDELTVTSKKHKLEQCGSGHIEHSDKVDRNSGAPREFCTNICN